MCGICGLIRFDNIPIQKQPIREMMRIMKHRGPDDEGVFIENNLGFGFVRLSIIDLSAAAHQPMYSNDERYVIVYNGEIFNYIELREDLIKEGYVFKTHSDTEVLLNAYIHWGSKCLHRFNGMWAFAIYDRIKKRVFAARDRYGIKPFYFLHTKDFFAFCSEIPPLLSLLTDRSDPDYQTIFDFLVFNRTDQTERTFFSEIKKLQHGHNLGIDLSFQSASCVIEAKKWYDLQERVSAAVGFENTEEFRDLFRSAINLRLRSDVPVGVCLSGGLDSSSIVSVLLSDFKKKDLNTFSAVYEKGQTGDETEFIDEYRPLLENMHFTTPDSISLRKDLSLFIKAHGEPIPDTSPYAQFKVMELAKGKVVVTLDGQGADEELAGYHYFFGFYFKDLLTGRKLGKLGREMYCYLTKHRSLFGLKSLIFFMLSVRNRTKARVNEKGYLTRDFVSMYKNSNSISANLYASKSLKDALIDHFEFKLEHLLKWEDRNSMWFSLESRMPFLDYRIVERSLATASELKIRNGMTKHILRESMKGVLPEKIRLRRDKVGFGTPREEWIMEPAWQDIIMGCIDSKSFKDRKLVDPQIAKKMYKDHLSGKINNSKEIWKWVCLELWFREFIDKKRIDENIN
jgi:asparagine synthase (glutamine-hydrolysing)